MEVNSYFGDFELFEEGSRRWTVLAKTFLVAYVIPRNEFLDLVKEE
jgi:CRP-like cAMP-binding protein